MKSAHIARHPFLRDMKPEHLEVLAEFAMPTHFAAGEFIFREGDTANRFYLIARGCVKLAPLAQVIGAGEVLGWSWLVPPYQWHFDARALEETDAIFFYGTTLRERCDEDHDLGYELMRRVAIVVTQRLQSTRDRLLKQRTD